MSQKNPMPYYRQHHGGGYVSAKEVPTFYCSIDLSPIQNIRSSILWVPTIKRKHRKEIQCGRITFGEK